MVIVKKVWALDFHGRKAVASLKQYGEHKHPHESGDFHGRKAVASLKLYRAVWAFGHGPYFHGRKAVASLKLQFMSRYGLRLEISTAERPWPH